MQEEVARAPRRQHVPSLPSRPRPHALQTEVVDRKRQRQRAVEGQRRAPREHGFCLSLCVCLCGSLCVCLCGAPPPLRLPLCLPAALRARAPARVAAEGAAAAPAPFSVSVSVFAPLSLCVCLSACLSASVSQLLYRAAVFCSVRAGSNAWQHRASISTTRYCRIILLMRAPPSDSCSAALRWRAPRQSQRQSSFRVTP